MTVDEQLVEIRKPTFFNDLQVRLRTIMNAFETAGVQPEGWVRFEVNGVPCRFQTDGTDAFLEVGQGPVRPAETSSASALYDWKAPLAWVGNS